MIKSSDVTKLNIIKYGQWITDKSNKQWLLTNYRALLLDIEEDKIGRMYEKYFNDEQECKIIKEFFKVFLFKVDLPTRSQMVRHRVNWQELSRRYVSGKRVPFEFYINEKLKDNEKVKDLISQSENLYFELIEDGIKPEVARRVIPQMCYTQIWGAFQPTQLENYFKLRLDEHAQWEIRQTALAMKELI
jgi:thymidylate synthase (FAD)